MKITRNPLQIPRWLGSHIAIFFFLWSLWLAFEYFGLGDNSYVLIHDNGDSNMPARLALDLALADGQLGYWNSQKVAGVDELATLPFDFDVLFFVVLPGWLAYGLFMWLQRFVAGYFTFRLLKESLHMDTLPALYAGLAYTLYAQYTQPWMGSFTLYDGLGLPGLPLLLWAMTRIGTRPRYRSYLYAAGFGALFALSLSYVFAPFVIALLFLWFVFVTPRLRPKLWSKFWIILFLFVVGWLVLELPKLWASSLNAPLSQRADRGMTHLELGGLLRQAKLVYSLVRLNVVPLGLTFVGLIVSRGRDRRLIALLGGVLLCFGLILGYPFIFAILDKYFGFLAGFQFDRTYLLVPFLASMSGGVGLHLIARTLNARDAGRARLRQPSRRYDLSLQTVLVAIVMGVIVLQSVNIKRRELGEFINESNYAALYEHPDLQRLAQDRQRHSPFRVATVTNPSGKFTQHPGYAWAYGLESADGYINLYPQRYQDYWERVIAPLIDFDQSRRDYFRSWGNRVYLYSPSGGFAQREVRARDYYNLELLSLANVRYIISPLPLQDEDLTLLPSQVRDEQLTWASQNKLERLRDTLLGGCPGAPLYIYENRQVLPRFFLAGQAQLFGESAQLLEALQRADDNALRSTAYLEQADVEGVPLDLLGGKSGEVSLRDYASDRITLDVSAESACILVVSNNYSPYWKAWVDGAETELFPADHAFQGMYVDGGQHKVVLEYRPPYAVRSGRGD